MDEVHYMVSPEHHPQAQGAHLQFPPNTAIPVSCGGGLGPRELMSVVTGMLQRWRRVFGVSVGETAKNRAELKSEVVLYLPQQGK